MAEQPPDRLLRTVSLAAISAGAAGSLGLMLRAGQRTPLLLLVAFVFWVASPFVALLWATRRSTPWTFVTRATLCGVAVIVALGSLTVYGELLRVKPQGAANAFLFVVVPPVSCAFIAVVLFAATLVSGRSSR